jgi:hypothetical protein
MAGSPCSSDTSRGDLADFVGEFLPELQADVGHVVQRVGEFVEEGACERREILQLGQLAGIDLAAQQ